MKKIISKGTDAYKTTCNECGAVFTYERDDVQQNYVRGGEWVSCPHCGCAHRHHGITSKWGRGPGCSVS